MSLVQIAAEMKPMLYPFAAVVALLGMRWIDLRVNVPRSLSDGELLAVLARRRECSEYDLFCDSAGDWQVSLQRVESDFKSYLLHDQMPFYVRDMLRRKRREAALEARAKMETLSGNPGMGEHKFRSM
jgi:hypothetical protein